MKLNRRQFFTAAGFAGLFAAGGCKGFPAITSVRSPNSRVRHLSIGCGNRAWGDINELCTHPSVEMAAFCDVDAKFLAQAKAKFPKARFYRDWREMYEKEFDSCDSVCVGAPDHHHVAMATAAMKAGKHVYLEKPMAKTMVEAKFLRDVAAQTGVVTQMGNQGHSGNNYWQFKHYVETGVIDVSQLRHLTAHMNNPRRWHKWNGKVSCFPKGETVPPALDWDTWLGTAAFHEYSKDYVQGEWRSWYDFGNGCLGDWGAHTMDTMHRFFDLGLPTEILIKDVKGWNPYVFPMQDTLTFKFAAKGKRPAIDLDWYEGVTNKPVLPKGYRQLAWGSDIPAAKGSTAEDAAKNLIPGKFFEMADGTAWQGGSHSSAIFMCGTDGKVPEYPKPGSNHYKNFLLAVMGLEETRSPFSVSAPLSEVFCLGCIAQRLNRGFRFDPVSLHAVDDPAADRFLYQAMREPWHQEFFKA